MRFVLPFCLIIGCVERPAPALPVTGQPTLYGLYGVGEVSSYGLNKLAGEVGRSWFGPHTAVEDFVGDAVTSDGPVYIVGHSAGAAQAIVMANRLHEYGKPVDRLFLVDISPPWFDDWTAPTVPKNVRVCYWWQTGLFNKERPIPAPNNTATKFIQMDSKGRNHLDIDEWAADQIIAQQLLR